MVRRLPPELLAVYNRIITDQLSHDFIELVEEDDVTIGHYIPHHAVHKDSETTPIRIVYDLSGQMIVNWLLTKLSYYFKNPLF